MLTFLKRILSLPEPSRGVPEIKYEPMGVEDWSGHTKILAMERGLKPEEALELQDEIDFRCVELDVFDKRIVMDKAKEDLKRRLILEVSHTVDRVFEEFLSKK